MKKILLSLLIVLLVFTTTSFADVTVNTDSEFTAFTSDADSSLDGWTGYTKNTDSTIDSNSWYSYVATKRVVGNVLANMPESWQETGSPSPTGNVFYTAQNFGSEYSFSGDFYNFQNQSFVYFNSAISEKDGKVTAKSGYRLYADRSKKVLEIQKCVNSSWITLVSEETAAWGWVLCHFDITFADGAITAKVTHGDKFDVTLSYDASADEDYVDIGYIGFGAASGKITVGKINVNYNSEKLYVMPSLESAGETFNGYTILPKDKPNLFEVNVDIAREGDVKNISLYVDNAFLTEMSQNGEKFSSDVTISDVGTHTIKAVLTDCYGNETTIASNIFFISDFASYPAVFTDAEENEISSIAQANGSVNISFKFNPCDRDFSAITLYAVKYDENGKILGIYPNKVSSPAKNIETVLSTVISNVSAGQTISAFLFEDYKKPSPLSGGFTLE